MPRPVPIGCPAEFSKRSRPAPVWLLDIATVNGTTFYWSDTAGSYPVALAGNGSIAYLPWILSVGEFRQSRSLRTDAGDITVQNVSGNSLSRDLMTALRIGEFEGALAILRRWDLILRATTWEFHGTARQIGADQVQATIPLTQLFDTNLVDLPAESFAQTCPWAFKTSPCGSTGSAVSCGKTLAACKDATRDRLIRFGGIVTPSASQEVSKTSAKANYNLVGSGWIRNRRATL